MKQNKNCESDPTWVVASSRALVTSTFLLVYSFLQFTSGFSPGGEGSSSAAGGGGPVTLPPVPGLTTNSCCFLLSKNYWFAWGANEWPRIGEDIDLFDSQQLLRLTLWPLKGFLSWHSALQGPSTLPRALLLELQRIKNTVLFFPPGEEVQGHYQ